MAYFANKFNLSPGYFGELIKTEIGRSPKDIINDAILAKAKELLTYKQSNSWQMLTVTNISQLLGFEYYLHFVRFFKRLTGKNPTEYRNAI